MVTFEIAHSPGFNRVLWRIRDGLSLSDTHPMMRAFPTCVLPCVSSSESFTGNIKRTVSPQFMFAGKSSGGNDILSTGISITLNVDAVCPTVT